MSCFPLRIRMKPAIPPPSSEILEDKPGERSELEININALKTSMTRQIDFSNSIGNTGLKRIARGTKIQAAQ